MINDAIITNRIISNSLLTISLSILGWILVPSSALERLKRQAVAAICIGKTVGYSRAQDKTFYKYLSINIVNCQLCRTYIDYVNPRVRHFYPRFMVTSSHFEQVIQSLLNVLRPGKVSVQCLDNLSLTSEARDR